MGNPTTLPADNDIQEAPRIIIEPSVSLPNQAVIAHKDYVEVMAPWAVEAHVGPAKGVQKLGDVPSWVAYVLRYADPSCLLLTWSEAGLRAVLDNHRSLTEPGRAGWVAEHPFITSDQWKAWRKLADGETRWTQQQAVDRLDALADDIVTPVASKVLDIIRTLRSSVRMEAKSVLLEDGGSQISFAKDSTVTGKTAIPPEIEIRIPVLKGHTTEQEGASIPVLYSLPVKVRPSVDDSSHTLGFRFLMPTAERVLEAVYADRVAAAKDLLGAELGKTLYRATA